MSRGIPPQVVSSAERSSQFSRQRGMRVDRVIYTYRTVRSADGLWHVLSSIQDAGADYSGRTNHLAQHLILNSAEASEFARHGHTPAGVMVGTVCTWGAHDGFCGWLEESPHAVSSEFDASWKFWNAYTGSGYCRLNLCSDAALRGTALVYGRGLQPQPPDAEQVLCLFAESQAGCLDKGWGTTFTTSLEPNDELSDFRWIGVAEDSPMLAKLEAAGGRVKITFDTPPPAARQPSPAASSTSLSTPTAASDGLSDLYKDAAPAVDAPTAVAGAKPPRIPPRRPVPTAIKESFLKGNLYKLAGATVALVLLATAGFLLRSLLSEKEFTFKGSLVYDYDGSPKSATLADGGSVFYLNEKVRPEAWSSQPPTDAERYQIGVEKSSWFGFMKQIVPTGKVLEIKQSEPVIVFPADRILKKQKPASVFDFGSEVGITIKPPAAAQALEVAGGVTVESRKISPPTNDWNAIARWEEGEYEVRVKTLQTTNFIANQAVANFTITNAFRSSDSPGMRTNQLAEPPSISPMTAPTESDGSSADVAQPPQSVSSAYYLALGPEALRLANEADVWRKGPNDIEVRQWGADSPVYRSIKDGRLAPVSHPSSDFTMSPGGLPEARKSTSEITSDELVFRASYGTDPQRVFVIGLKKDGTSDGAVRDLLPGKAWLRLNKTSLRLELASTNEFFKHAKLLPSGSKWILVYEDQPYSEGKGDLRLESDTPDFDVNAHIDEAERDRETAAKKLTSLAEQAKSPPAAHNYFDQNRPKLLQPLEALGDESPLATSLAGQIRGLQKPNVDTKDAASNSTLASALLIGALKIAYGEPEIQARMKLSIANQNKIDGQLDKAKSDQGGRNYGKISDKDLLPPDELESWLTNNGENSPSIRDVRSAAVNWLNSRSAKLQEPPEDTPSLNDPVKEVLLKLRQGMESCSEQFTAATQKADPTLTPDSLAKQIQTAEEKKRVLSSWGTLGASGHARLELQLGQSEAVTLLPMVFLGPDMKAEK
jgi:hypothetical protein